jgi:hypothetical protein
VDDADFEAGTITLREKKRDTSRELTFRSEPMAEGLKNAIRPWPADDHPGGPYMICARKGRGGLESRLGNDGHLRQAEYGPLHVSRGDGQQDRREVHHSSSSHL